jgi:hypothetical protein
MIGTKGKMVVAGAVALAAVVGAQSSADAAIIGSANYSFQVGSFTDPGPSGLDLLLDGVTIFSIANPVPGSISLASAAPGAFAALVAVLSDGIENDITTSAFATAAIPDSVTISDFNYRPPNTDDFQGSAPIVDVILTINSFGTTAVPFPPPPGREAYITGYNIDISVEAIPVPGALVSGMTGLALVGLLAARRNRRAAA